MNITIFVLLFIYLALGGLMRMFASSLFHPREIILPFKDKKLLAKLKSKTGINFEIKIIKSEKFFGAMHGIPTKPIMTLSSKALEVLNKGELEWLFLHEAGHCLGYHVVILILGFWTTLGFGIYLTSNMNTVGSSIAIPVVIAFVLNVIYQQIGRVTEYFADKYAVINIDNPMDMASANQKLRERSLKRRTVYNSEITLFLFTPHISYSNRILMAQKEAARRGN